jgi:diguanylate cyclase (GGDEF)-like protein
VSRNERRRTVPYPLAVVVLALAYYAAARGALALGVLPGNIAPVWPSTGIAVLALVVGGRRLWPGVFLGEMLANAGHVPVLSLLGMATGDALEAAVGAWLLTGLSRIRSLDRVADVVRFAGCAAVAAVLGATAGVASLGVGGVIGRGQLDTSWLTWWAGDLLGCLVVLPLALSAAARPRSEEPRSVPAGNRVEVAAVTVAAAVALALFGAGANAPYLLLAVGAWSAVRLIPRQAAFITLGASALAVIRTAAGDGPFVRADTTQSLLVLDAFVAVLALTGLVIAAAVRERDLARSELESANRHLTARDRQQVHELGQSQAELAHQALHDSLTGLPNRVLLADRLSRALARNQRYGGGVAVLFADLDRFKLVNDSRGHAAGDALLVSAAERLRGAVRSDDTVARFGGDEFVVICEDGAAGGEARMVAERISESFREPFLVAGQEVFLSVSVGVAVAAPGDSPEELLRDADAAMYRAKDSGRARCEFFDERMRTQAARRLETESALHRATERHELRLDYQPVVEIATGRIVGVEALVRWQHPEHGLLGPASFIPLAEETGLIVPMGNWVLHEALRQWSRWRRHSEAQALTLAVNLSAGQLCDPNLAATVADALTRYGVGPWELCLELTESSFMADDERHGTLAELQALGVQLAIDDFGTGYSSLTYLQRFPVTVLKIDQSFVRGLGREPSDEAIVESVIHLAHALRLRVVAEGVERADQVAALRRLGCDVAQGFYLARPAPAREIDALLVAASASPPRVPAGSPVTTGG